MERPPDFFLCAPRESKELAGPRACWEQGCLRSPMGDGLMLIQIEPPLPRQKHQLGDKDVTNLILAPRFPDLPNQGMALPGLYSPYNGLRCHRDHDHYYRETS
jgi:hypothetical protein